MTRTLLGVLLVAAGFLIPTGVFAAFKLLRLVDEHCAKKREAKK